MNTIVAPLRRLGGLLRATLLDRRGAAAVEFSLVAVPFVFMLFALLESGLIFVVNMDLSNATMSVARQVRTGNLVGAGLAGITSGVTSSVTDFRTSICNRLSIVPTATCMANLQVDMRTNSAFGSGSSATNPLANGNFSNASLCFYSGAGGSIVTLRTFYLWPISTPLLLTALVNATSYTVGSTTVSGKYHVLVSSEAFKVEQNSNGLNTGNSC